LFPLAALQSGFVFSSGEAAARELAFSSSGENRRDSALMQVSFGSGAGTDCQFFSGWDGFVW